MKCLNSQRGISPQTQNTVNLFSHNKSKHKNLEEFSFNELKDKCLAPVSYSEKIVSCKMFLKF